MWFVHQQNVCDTGLYQSRAHFEHHLSIPARSVHAQAIIRTGGNNPISSCDDNPFSTAPTCGWAIDGNGNNVYASQGFCCSCTSSALAAATFTSGTNQRTSLTAIGCPISLLRLSILLGVARCLVVH